MTSMYINGLGLISPQNTFDNCNFLDNITQNDEDFFCCLEPNYKNYIDFKSLRRMSRLIKMGITAANISIKDAETEQIDGILTATAYGCLADTEKFLRQIIEDKEHTLAPTAFIQSTHNTVGGQIALLLKNHNYNITYTSGGSSFENALLDAKIELKKTEKLNFLVGGLDEITKTFFKIQRRTQKLIYNSEFKIGEGAGFFVLSNYKTNNSYAKIADLKILYKMENKNEIKKELEFFIKENGLIITDIDLFIVGKNGLKKFDDIFHYLEDDIMDNSNILNFKQLCGEYPTASAFALWLGTRIIREGTVPKGIKNRNRTNKKIKTVMIINNYKNINYSFILLKGIGKNKTR